MNQIDFIREKIHKIFQEKLQISLPTNLDGAIIWDAPLQLDSMALLELTVAMEYEFGIALDDDELSEPKHFEAAEKIIALVFGKLSNS